MKLNRILSRSRSFLHLSKILFSTSQQHTKKESKEELTIEYDENRSTYKEEKLKSEDFDTLKKPDDSLADDDFLPDYFIKDAPTYRKNTISINLPWLINGAPELEIKTRFAGEQVFGRMNVHKNEVLEHMFKIYRAVLLAGADRDYEFLHEYCEETFCNKFLKRLDELNKNDIKLKIFEDVKADKGKPMQVEANMYDHTVIKGLSLIRKENGSEDDYFIDNDINDMGFISYVPKYISDPANFVDPKKNKVIHEDAHKIIFRAYVEFKTGYKLYLLDKNGNSLFDYPTDYTWRHIGVFETQMTTPDKFNKYSESENLLEWITKHKFSIWKIVDLDNWLVGNPLVIPKFQAKTYSPS